MILRAKTAIQLTIVFMAGVFLASTAGAVDNYVQIRNNWTITMWANFKCYTNSSGESNSCRYENTIVTIKPGDSHKWSYKYTKGMGCQKISIIYGRYDRSCEACTKKLDVAFAEDEAKIFTITAQGSGDLGFIMTPVHGTHVH